MHSVGSLFIDSTPNLTNYSGLNNLTTITNDFYLYGSTTSTIIGFSNLTIVGRNFTITSTSDLVSLNGFTNLHSVGQTLAIDSNAVLQSVTGFNTLTTIGDSLNIASNNFLLALPNMLALTTIGGSLIIGSNQSLPSLIGLSAVNSIADLNIYQNPNLTDLSSLLGLHTVNNQINISDNNALTSLHGLDNINANTLTYVSIANNPNLSTCAIASICERIASVLGLGTTYVANNSLNCNSIQEIVTICNAATSAITLQPANATICTTVGATTSFAVTTTMPNPIYKWQYRVPTTTNPNPTWITINSTNAAVYANYNTAILGVTKTSSLPVNGTQYRVLIDGNTPSLTSDTANITILGTVKPGKITSPTSVCVGNSITFTVTAYVGTAFQWQSATSATATFSNISGATASSYTATNMQSNSNKAYRVVVTNGPCDTTVTSTSKTITVDPPSVAGTIILGGGAICSGSSGALKVSGYKGKIQWEYSIDGTNYVNAPKAADNTTAPFGTTSITSMAAMYMVTNITADVYFRARVTSGACDAVYTVPVQYITAIAATVGTAGPYIQTICARTGTIISLSAATGTITWERSTNYNAATPTWVSTTSHNLSYNTGNLVYNTAFRAKVTIGTCSTLYSNVVYVYLTPKPIAKNITANSTNPSATTTGTAICTTDFSKVLTVGSGYTGTLQWQKSITSTTTGFTDIVGATAESYTIGNPTVGANYFRLVFTNSCGESVIGKAITVFYKDCSIPKAKVVTIKPVFTAVAYPNPFEENFNISITGADETPVSVAVYDMTGKLIENNQLLPNDVLAVPIGNNYPSGIYNIVIAQGNEYKLLRVIKQ